MSSALISCLSRQAQFSILKASCQIERRIVIGMGTKATDDTAKRLLVGAISTVGIVTHTALLRGVRALDGGRRLMDTFQFYSCFHDG